MSVNDVDALIRQEIESITSIELKNVANASLIEPVKLELEWDYGEEESFEVWQCFSIGALRVLYCSKGHGPEFPWGVSELSATDLGPDSLWKMTLEEAIKLAFVSRKYGQA